MLSPRGPPRDGEVAPRGRRQRPGAVVVSVAGRPGIRQGSQTPHRGAVLPVNAYSLAVSCGGRGVSLSTSGPPAFSAPSAPRVVLFQDTTGIAPSPARYVAPRPGSRHAGLPGRRGGPSRALAALLAVGGTPPPRALPRMWRTVPCDASSTAYAAALQHGTRAALFAAFTRRALRPGHVACGDRCVRRTIPPRHHAGIKDLLSTTLGATGRKADLAPRHYRSRPTGRRAAEGALGRFEPPER